METEEVQQDEQVLESTPPPTPEWRAGFPEEIRALDIVTRYDKAESPMTALLNGFVAGEKNVGADKVVLPGREATDEERREFFSKVGCPESTDGYTAPTENISEHFDADLFQGLREDAHRLGLTPQQYAGMSRALDARTTMHREKEVVNQTAQQEQWESDLHQKYGDAYEQNVKLAQGVAYSFGGDEFVALMDSSGLGSHPLVVDFCAKVARELAEDEILGGGGAQTSINTPDQANAEWQALQLDKEFVAALTDRNHVGHKAAVEKQTLLMQQMHPEPK